MKPVRVMGYRGGTGVATLAITGAFAAATVGVAYSSSLPITGGTEPYTLTGGTGVASGSLDTGFALSITGSSGAYFLTLTCASPARADTMTFTASVDSNDGQTATTSQSVVVNAAAIRGLVALYKLDESSGTVAHDSSGNGNHGTYVGGNVTLGKTSILPSGSGHGASFGNASYMSLPNGILATTGRPFTIFGWGNSTDAAVNAGQQIMASASGGFNFYLYQSHMIGGIAGVSNKITDSRTISSNTTHFWALVVNASGDAIIYDNGAASPSTPAAFSSSDRFSNAVVVGSYSTSTFNNNFRGTLQNVGVCNVALTSTEITDIYTNS